MSGSLAGFLVLDFCWIGAGALVTKALTELGAEVIRVESRSHPDNLRLTPPFRPGTEGLEASGYFASRNPNKKSFALNMKHQEAREIARQLVGKVDAVTSNFRPGVMERWGLSYEDVKQINPEILYLVMPMQGSDGPHRSFIGFGSTIAALSGLVQLSGSPGRLPIGTGTHYPDHVPNPGHSLVGMLAAIFEKRRSGQGQRIELSQLESTVNVIGPAVLAASAGHRLSVDGNREPGVVPRGVFASRDGKWTIVTCSTDEQWRALVGEMTDDGLGAELAGLSSEERSHRVDEIENTVAEWLSRLDRAEALRRLDAALVPNGPVNNSRDVLHDDRLEKRGFWEEIDHPVIGSMPMFRLPFVNEPDIRIPMTRPPTLGEHTWEVAADLLGMDRATFDDLTEREVFY